MAAEAEIQFVSRTWQFFLDPHFQPPVSVDLHPGLATERAFLKAWINSSPAPHDVAGGGAGSALASPSSGIDEDESEIAMAAPLPPADRRAMVKEALINFAHAVLAAGTAVRGAVVPTSHLWALDLYGAIVSDVASTETAVAMGHLDTVANAWETVIARILIVVGAPEKSYARYYAPFLHRYVGALYRRGPPRRISFRNMLHALCADATATNLFRVPPRTNQVALAIGHAMVTAAAHAITTASAVVGARYNYISAAAAVVVLRRVRDQPSSRAVLSEVNVTGVVGARPTPAAHVEIVVGAVWRRLLLSRTEAAAQRSKPHYAHIHNHDRGRLVYPREPFVNIFALALVLADGLLERRSAMPSVLRTTNDLAIVHAAVTCATQEQFAAVIAPISKPALADGWPPQHVRALWRMFVRYALMTALRQDLRRGRDTAEASVFDSSSSFRSVLGILGKSRSSTGSTGGSAMPGGISAATASTGALALPTVTACRAGASAASMPPNATQATGCDDDGDYDTDLLLMAAYELDEEDTDEDGIDLLASMHAGHSLDPTSDSDAILLLPPGWALHGGAGTPA